MYFGSGQRSRDETLKGVDSLSDVEKTSFVL